MSSRGHSVVGLALPQAPEKYDPQVFQRLLEYVRELEEKVYTRGAHIEISAQEDSGGRRQELILYSPDGTAYGLRISDDGLTVTGQLLGAVAQQTGT